MAHARGRDLIAGISALALAALVAAGPGRARASVPDLPQVTAAGMHAILAPPLIRRAGARDPDVTIVEYFDYNCPFCRKLVPTLTQLLAGDRKVALIYKDWPILGAPSVYAARCALAAEWQGKYLAAHDALLGGPRLSGDDQIEAILQRAGIDLPRLRKDMAAHSAEITAQLERNEAEAQALRLDGTPGILVGRSVVPGIADVDFFRKLVADVRAAGPTTTR